MHFVSSSGLLLLLLLVVVGLELKKSTESDFSVFTQLRHGWKCKWWWLWFAISSTGTGLNSKNYDNFNLVATDRDSLQRKKSVLQVTSEMHKIRTSTFCEVKYWFYTLCNYTDEATAVYPNFNRLKNNSVGAWLNSRISFDYCHEFQSFQCQGIVELVSSEITLK